jgi:NADH-quinone oxidoreductase subunit K
VSVPPSWFLAVAAGLFAIGSLVVLTRRNAIVVFMGIELMLNAANLTLLAGARVHGGPAGPIALLFVLALAAAEVAVGLAIIVLVHRSRGTVDLGALDLLKG